MVSEILNWQNFHWLHQLHNLNSNKNCLHLLAILKTNMTIHMSRSGQSYSSLTRHQNGHSYMVTDGVLR